MVGSGVSGLTAGHVLARSCEVVLYEADTRLGGHADTHLVPVPDGGVVPVDTGFIVHNDRTYPTLQRLFGELGVSTQPSEMSMSVRCEESGLEYAGAKGPRGLFAQPRSLFRPAYLAMLGEVPRFHRAALRLLGQPTPVDDELTLARFVEQGGYSRAFREWFLVPLVAAVWSCPPGGALDYPARYLFSFLDHHGMLAVRGSPTWRTVTGGSREYVERIAKGLHQVRRDSPVVSVRETADSVEVTDSHGHRDRFDAAVLATHSDQALAMLDRPTPIQHEVLGAMPYARNEAVLHTDTSVLPRAKSAWASWNYLRRTDTGANTGAPVVVSYDLTHLQRLDRGTSPVTRPRFLLTLGAAGLVDPDLVVETMTYAHPLYTPTSVAARRRLPEIDTPRIRFAGAYHGWGFHEDGARAGMVAAAGLGARW